MPSDKHDLISTKATDLIFYSLTLLWPNRCLLTYRSTYNAFFMDLPASSFVSHSSLLLTAKGVDLVVANDGFPLKWKLSIFFIVTILIAEVLFEQFLICTTV